MTSKRQSKISTNIATCLLLTFATAACVAGGRTDDINAALDKTSSTCQLIFPNHMTLSPYSSTIYYSAILYELEFYCAAMKSFVTMTILDNYCEMNALQEIEAVACKELTDLEVKLIGISQTCHYFIDGRCVNTPAKVIELFSQKKYCQAMYFNQTATEDFFMCEGGKEQAFMPGTRCSESEIDILRQTTCESSGSNKQDESSQVTGPRGSGGSSGSSKPIGSSESSQSSTPSGPIVSDEPSESSENRGSSTPDGSIGSSKPSNPNKSIRSSLDDLKSTISKTSSKCQAVIQAAIEYWAMPQSLTYSTLLYQMHFYCAAIKSPNSQVMLRRQCNTQERNELETAVCRAPSPLEKDLIDIREACQYGIDACLSDAVKIGDLFKQKKYCEAMNYKSNTEDTYKCLTENKFIPWRCFQDEYNTLKQAACEANWSTEQHESGGPVGSVGGVGDRGSGGGGAGSSGGVRGGGGGSVRSDGSRGLGSLTAVLSAQVGLWFLL